MDVYYISFFDGFVPVRLQGFLQVIEHFIFVLLGVHPKHYPILLVLRDDGRCLFLEGDKSLLDSLGVIVGSA